MTSSTREIPAPRAVSVAFTERRTRLAVHLEDGRVVSAPLDWYPRLLHGSPSELRRWSLIGGGHGIHWPALDEDISVENLLAGKRSVESQRSIARWLERRVTKHKMR